MIYETQLARTFALACFIEHAFKTLRVAAEKLQVTLNYKTTFLLLIS